MGPGGECGIYRGAPAENGTMMVTGRSGQAACAGSEENTPKTANIADFIGFFGIAP